MIKNVLSIVVILLLVLTTGCKEEKPTKIPSNEKTGEFAPPDAYLDGNEHPYYGSENAWDIGDDALGSRFFERDPKLEYKRRGQKALLLSIAGKPDLAENYCRELLSKDSQDLESYFNLAVALALQDKMDEAVQNVKTAVDRGLPLGRFLAGPRELLKPLVESKGFQEFAEPFHLELIQGPMLGRVSDSGASFWVRTYHSVDVSVQVSKHQTMANAVSSNTVKSNPSKDYTAIVKIEKLKPNTLYYYQVIINNKNDPNALVYSFRTFPKVNRSAKFKVVFGGGAGYVPWHERIWDVINGYNPSAFIWIGDNVYIDTPFEPADIRYCYYERQSRPEFRRMVSSMSNYAIWDDHDIATDDCWLGPYKDKPEWKMQMLDIYKEQWINPFYGTKEWPASYFNFKMADVEFFVLDGRFYRTNPFDKNPTQLGPNQKAWLLNSLKKSTAVFKVLVSGTPWAFDSKPGAKDTWNGFHEERKEIFDFLADNSINGVILLSGDRHRSDIRQIERPNGYTLYDWEDCRLTNQIVHPVEPGALFGYNDKQCFGLLEFNTKKSDPAVTFTSYSIDNEKAFSMTLKLSELSDKD